MNVSIGTIARTACLALALTNQILSAAGKPVLPIQDDQLESLVTTGLTVAASLAAWWKNNSFTTSPPASNHPAPGGAFSRRPTILPVSASAGAGIFCFWGHEKAPAGPGKRLGAGAGFMQPKGNAFRSSFYH